MTSTLTRSPHRRAARLAAATAAAAFTAALTFTASPAFASGGGGGGNGGGGNGGGSVTPALKSITFTPASVTGGGGETATVTFASSASQGAVVQLASSDPAVAGFDPNTQDEAVVTPGHSSVAVAIDTTAVTAPTAVTITATAFGNSISATLTVNPGSAPAPDTVRITEFRWDKGVQTIAATDSNPNAILTVFDADGTFTGITLTNQGGGRYQDQRGEVFEPDQPIIVESNFGGSATATVTN
ncbi:hypothetical protein [Actinospica robiniae]|uniref:hypothetical protein n=1 Tax=Actinospica robiniae TaxID=304901 RepID=UPI0004078B2A|nr:hypothetical protein [Actinospica robiniae]